MIREYNLHGKGVRADDAVAKLDLIVSSERARGEGVFAVVTGYGSTGGTSIIKTAVLEACRDYLRTNHIRGYLDGDKAGDLFCDEALRFPAMGELPLQARMIPNPGVIYIAV